MKSKKPLVEIKGLGGSLGLKIDKQATLSTIEKELTEILRRPDSKKFFHGAKITLASGRNFTLEEFERLKTFLFQEGGLQLLEEKKIGPSPKTALNFLKKVTRSRGTTEDVTQTQPTDEGSSTVELPQNEPSASNTPKDVPPLTQPIPEDLPRKVESQPVSLEGGATQSLDLSVSPQIEPVKEDTGPNTESVKEDTAPNLENQQEAPMDALEGKEPDTTLNDKSHGEATVNPSENLFKNLNTSDALLIRQTVHSGQNINSKSSIVVMGDVNAGAEVRSENDIIVLGSLRGMVHAGFLGNRKAVIFAIRMKPTQIRIADMITQPPPQDKQTKFSEPEVAFIEDEYIIIETCQKLRV